MGKTNLTLKILLIFTLYLISGGGASNKVRGYSGGGVLIKCKYDKKYTSKNKYFCKGSRPNCGDLIKTGVKNKWVNKGRFSLIDKPSSAEFWVMIRELTVKDFGTYQCAVDITLSKDIYTPVELKIHEDYKKSINVKGHVGQTVNISCKYPQSLSTKPKFLCRRRSTADCYYTASVTESREWIKEGKFSLYDEKARMTFTVSISRVTEGYSGEYWCGAESDWEKDRGYKIYFTQINLRVTEPTVKPSASPSTSSKPGTTEATTSSTSTPTVTSAYNTSPGLSPEKNVSQSSTSTSSLTTLHTSKTILSSSSPTTGGSSSSPMISVVAVILLLVLTGLLFFIVALRKKRNPQATSPDQTLSDSSNNHRVSHTVYDYEDIKATGRHPTPDTGASTVYSTAQLPTNPSDPSHTLYHNVQLRTGLGDFSNPIYSTAQDPQLPRSPSDSSVSDPQRQSVQPAEDPAYATVKFTKNDAVTIATVNKEEEDSCDYATVK
ncbi:polymeric immunoglobulin receptor-like [Astyanax mexicanus]|nr:polymeric immunoglobulin receptor-like [Astyanax mexicanus]